MLDSLNLGHECVVPFGPFGPLTAQFRMAPPGGVTPLARRGDLQHLADRLDPELAPVLIDIAFQFAVELHLGKKSAGGLENLVGARQLLVLSCSKVASRSRSLVVSPARSPASISARFTQSSRV